MFIHIIIAHDEMIQKKQMIDPLYDILTSAVSVIPVPTSTLLSTRVGSLVQREPDHGQKMKDWIILLMDYMRLSRETCETVSLKHFCDFINS